MMTLESVPKTQWEKLQKINIYFGHQSVGNDLIQGLQEIMAQKPWIQLNIVEYDDNDKIDRPSFQHSMIGSNEKPETKNAAFKEAMTQGLKNKVDVAFFKYCFLDINEHTNLNEAYNDYIATINEVKESNPNTKIIHFTVPLMTVQTGPKAWIKSIIGRPIGGVAGNTARNNFNEMLISDFSATDLIFDIAKYESTLPGGERVSFDNNGNIFYALADEYTYDGGHLNQIGRQKIAEDFLLFLVNNVI